jgi:hypothetical protein
MLVDRRGGALDDVAGLDVFTGAGADEDPYMFGDQTDDEDGAAGDDPYGDGDDGEDEGADT